MQEYICSCLGGMGARASMKKFILERNKTEEVQAASSGGRHCLEWVTLRGGREGGVERGVSGGGTGGRDAAAAFHRRGESPRNCQAGSWKDSLGSSPGGHCSSHQQLGGG